MSSERFVWVDAAKGFAIIAVVMGHTLDYFLRHMGSYETPAVGLEFVYYFEHFLYTFHVPLFFLMSGLLFYHTVNNTEKAVGKVWLCFKLYLTWSFLIVIAKWLFSSFVASPLDVMDILTVLYHPVGVTWFLYCLSIYMLMEVLGKHLFIGAGLIVSVILYLVFSYLFYVGFHPDWFEFPKRIMKYYIFFSMGVYFSQKLIYYKYSLYKMIILLFIGVIGFVLYEFYDQEIKILYLLASCCFVLLIVSFFKGAPEKLKGVFAWFGRYALQIYLTHIFIVYAIMSLLNTNYILAILLALVLGVLSPVYIYRPMPLKLKKVLFGG